MDNKNLVPLLGLEIERQCAFALLSWEDLEGAKSSRELHRANRVWLSIHSLLVAVANISKVLWPTKKRHEARGRVLRHHFGIRNNSALKCTAFRNCFEHYDERLEDWLQWGYGVVVDGNLGPPPEFVDRFGNPLPKICLRQFDPETSTVFFRGDRIELNPVIEAVRLLQHTLTERGVTPSEEDSRASSRDA